MVKKVQTGVIKKRIRRSPEVLMKEIEAKKEKMANRICKKNKEAVAAIAHAILKRAKFDFSTFTESDLNSVKQYDQHGIEIIDEILEKAKLN